MSQVRLARDARLAPGTISDIERGIYEPSEANRWAIAQALGPAPEVDAYLLGRGPLPGPPTAAVTTQEAEREPIPAAEVNLALLEAIASLAPYQLTGQPVPLRGVLRMIEGVSARLGLRPSGATTPEANGGGA